MNKNKKILVTGATGQQGGAVVRHLLADGWSVRALTRNINKPAAEALATAGVELFQGDFTDRVSLDRALDGVYGAFSVQQPWEHGPEKEVEQGKAFADAVKNANIEHFVYTSVGSAETNTGIPHFDSKWEIEQYIRKIGLPVTTVRPVFFMENFFMPDWKNGIKQGTLAMALKEEKTLQLTAVDDVGGVVAMLFNQPGKYKNGIFEIAGDELTGSEIARIFAEKSGKPLNFVELTVDQVREYSKEMAIMFQWFNDVGYKVNIPKAREMYPQLTSFETWVAGTGLKIFTD